MQLLFEFDDEWSESMRFSVYFITAFWLSRVVFIYLQSICCSGLGGIEDMG